MFRVVVRRLSAAAKPSLNYESFMTEMAKARRPSPIRALIPLLNIPGVISLGGGVEEPVVLSKNELETALQYGPTQGLPRMVSALQDIQQREHSPKYGIDVVVTTGSQEAIAYAFEMLLEPYGRSSLLIEESTYSGSLSQLEPMGINLVQVRLDNEGIVPQHLKEVLDNWKGPAPKPRVLYTIPNGANPTGTTQSVKRKAAIYQIAQEHNLIILEDDPYYFLQFTDKRVPSYLSMDVDGRVLRFDSFSKVLSSGLRLGFVTGPARLIDTINLHLQSRICHTSNISQTIALKLLERWGRDGFEAHISKTRNFYQSQCQMMLAAAEKHLHDVAEWTPPAAGMFLWLKLKGVTDSFEIITKHAIKEKVVLVPGSAFYPRNSGPNPYVRASFSTASSDMMNEALLRLRKLLVAQHNSK